MKTFVQYMNSKRYGLSGLQENSWSNVIVGNYMFYVGSHAKEFALYYIGNAKLDRLYIKRSYLSFVLGKSVRIWGQDGIGGAKDSYNDNYRNLHNKEDDVK